jgi:hypothetical protein
LAWDKAARIIAAKTPMMAMTTSSSTSVKARLAEDSIGHLPLGDIAFIHEINLVLIIPPVNKQVLLEEEQEMANPAG